MCELQGLSPEFLDGAPFTEGGDSMKIIWHRIDYEAEQGTGGHWFISSIVFVGRWVRR